MNASRYTAVDNFLSKSPRSHLKETLIIIFGCFLLSSSLLADEWNVGFQIIQVPDPVVDSSIEVAIWYPTKSVGRKETVGMTVLHIAKGAEPISSS